MNIFEALRISHVAQRALADHLLQTAGDSPERASLFKELKRELAAHAAAEERFFYVPLIAHDVTQEPSRHGIAEHHQMDIVSTAGTPASRNGTWSLLNGWSEVWTASPV